MESRARAEETKPLGSRLGLREEGGLPGGGVEADQAEGRSGAEEEGAFDEVAVGGEAGEEIGLGKGVEDVAEFLVAVVFAGGVAEAAAFAVEVGEHGAELGDRGRGVADGFFGEGEVLGGEPFYGLAAGVAGFVGVEGEHGENDE